MKKITLIFAFMLAVAGAAAQSMYVHKTDGNVYEFKVSDVDSINFAASTTDDFLYTVTYMPNGGEGEAVVDTVLYGFPYGFRPVNLFEKDGYLPFEWNTKADGTGIYYLSTDTLPMLTRNIVVYPKWYAITPIDSLVWLSLEGKPTELWEITTKTTDPSATEITALAYPSKVDHLVGGFRFGIVGVDDYIDLYNAPAKTSITSDIVKLEVREDPNKTKIDGVIGVRGLKQGEAKIWVEMGDAALGGDFTVDDYGTPKRDTLTIKVNYVVTPIDSLVWLSRYGESTELWEITTETKSAPWATEINAIAYPSKVDHLVGGFRFGIVGVNDSIDLYNAPAKTSITSDIVKLEVVYGTKIDGVIGVRGLKQGEAKIWVEMGDAALGGAFTVDDYGTPKRDTLTIKVYPAVTDIKVYKEGESTDCGTSTQTLTQGDVQVFEAKISDDEAHGFFKGNIVWKTYGNEGGYISLVQDPTNKEKVTVTAVNPATGNAAPYLYARVTDDKGNVTESSEFRVEVQGAASSEAEGLEFTSVTVELEDFYGYGNGDFYKYIFTTAAGDQLIIPALSPTDGSYDGFLFDEDREWVVEEYGSDIGIECCYPSVGITIGASGTIYELIGGTITISHDGASATIDLTAYPIVGGAQGTVTKVTGTWTGTKPADPRP